MTENDKLLLIIGAAGLGLAVLSEWTAAAADAVGDAAKTTGEAVNPVNDGNIFNRAAESVYSKVTGSKDSPGADVAQWWYGGE